MGNIFCAVERVGLFYNLICGFRKKEVLGDSYKMKLCLLFVCMVIAKGCKNNLLRIKLLK